MTRYDGLTWSGASRDNCTLTLNCYNGHDGIDFSTGGLTGRLVVATAGGRVQFTGVEGGYGYRVRVWHEELGFSTFYAHLLPNIPVQPGQSVQRGQLVGYSGCTGDCDGAHLHFGVYNAQTGGDPIDPYGWGDPQGPDDPWTPDRSYRYLWATRIGVRLSGDFVTKEGTLGAGWHHNYAATSDIALSGSRMGRVSNATGSAKDGEQDDGRAWRGASCLFPRHRPTRRSARSMSGRSGHSGCFLE
jgi:hypothetical protein